MMDLNAPIFVAGHKGLVGSAVVESLKGQGHTRILTADRQTLDLRNQVAVADWFAKHRPHYVILAAAKVGGIGANKTFPAEFIHQNLLIQTNVIHSAYLSGVQKLLFLASSCVYPMHAPQPLNIRSLHTGPLDPNTEPYAIAKIAGMAMCQSYFRQYGARYISAIPANLYGVNDNWDLQNAHVLPALLRKAHTAKLEGRPTIEIWGDGTPCREFMLNEDLADACVFLMNHYEDADTPINIGSGQEVQICALAEIIKEVVGWEGGFVFDTTKPNGAPRKLMDNSALEALGYRRRHSLREGIQKVYDAVFVHGERVIA